MRKLFAFLTIVILITSGLSNYSYAQVYNEEKTTAVAESIAGDSVTVAEEIVQDVAVVAEPEAPKSFHQVLKEKFIEGGPGFMGIVLLALIYGLAISIERIIYLSMASINTRKLLKNFEEALDKGGIAKAKEVSVDVVKQANDVAKDISKSIDNAITPKDETDERIKTLFVKCAGCHGANAEKSALGKSQIIKGWDITKTQNALSGYKNGSYGGAMKGVMKGQVARLSDADIKEIAEKISKL